MERNGWSVRLQADLSGRLKPATPFCNALFDLRTLSGLEERLHARFGRWVRREQREHAAAPERLHDEHVRGGRIRVHGHLTRGRVEATQGVRQPHRRAGDFGCVQSTADVDEGDPIARELAGLIVGEISRTREALIDPTKLIDTRQVRGR